MNRITLILTWMLVLTSAAYAQVPQMINYQGRVAVGGTNFTGAGQFKFALVNTNGSQTFWSNDGTSVGGSEPANAVSLSVSDGLYSVLLGDISLTNMTAIPATVFNNSDVRQRVWFNDGAHGSQLLTPDQRIASVGYAVIAGNVPDGAITTAKLADNAVTSSKIASGAVTALDIAAGAIGTAQIANGAITSAKIADGSITSADLAKPPRSGTIPSATLAFDFWQATFAVLFNPVFNTTPNVTLSIESGNPSIGYGTSLQVTSKSTTQFSGVIGLGQRPVPRIVDYVASFERTISLAVVNGNPAISYNDSMNGDLKYVRATNADGTVWGAPLRVDTPGRYTSLAVVNGNPAISYYDHTNDLTNGDLKYVRATNANGTAWGLPVRVDTTGDVGEFTSLAVVNGNPAISYEDFANSDVKYVRATNANGTAWGMRVRAVNGGHLPSLAVVNGNPAISCIGITQDLKYVRATDASGTAWGTPVSIDTTGSVGYPSLAVVDHQPAIGYTDFANTRLKFIRQDPPFFTIDWIALEP
jgi:hypothetical protein